MAVSIKHRSRNGVARTASGRTVHRSGEFPRLGRGNGGDRVRTDDPLLAKQVLFQLSYAPIPQGPT